MKKKCEKLKPNGWYTKREGGELKQVWGPEPCSKNGIVERNGKHYCRQHAPATGERFDVIVFYSDKEPINSKVARAMLDSKPNMSTSGYREPESSCGHRHGSRNAALVCARKMATGMNAHGSPSARVEKIHADGSREVIHTEMARGCRVTLR